VATITNLKAGKGRSKKIKVYLDGQPALTLDPEVVATSHLRVKKELSPSELDDLQIKNRLKQAISAAERLLAFRPRSEKEIRLKLAQKKFDQATVGSALDYLREHRLVDDAAFARYWAENRAAFSPRSKRMVTQELRQKGVAADVAVDTSDELDDETAAYEAGNRKASRIATADYEEFRRKLGEFLKRRGFSYDVIDASLRRLWQERVNKE
jgi:regulatory protein